jgi:hypothetical protein
MRRAFVLQLSNKATRDHLEGRIEHVDSGKSGHFDSIDDMVCFVRQVLADLEFEEAAPAQAHSTPPPISTDSVPQTQGIRDP